MNPTLIHCPACNREISVLAESCPGCGIPFGAKRQSGHGVFYYVFFGTISLIATVFILGFIGCFGTLFVGSVAVAKHQAERQATEQARAAEEAERQAHIEALAQQEAKAREQAEAEKKANDDLIKSKKEEQTKSATIKFLSEQAILGMPMAQYRLAQKYIAGDGVAMDLDRARFWLEASCTNGYAEASNLLQKMQKEISQRKP
jgi:hypothetical protein